MIDFHGHLGAARIRLASREGGMLSASLARALAARGIHYDWFTVALTMGYLLCSSATLSIPGVLLTPMSRDLGWSIGDLSGPLGLRVALFGLVAPFSSPTIRSIAEPVITARGQRGEAW